MRGVSSVVCERRGLCRLSEGLLERVVSGGLSTVYVRAVVLNCARARARSAYKSDLGRERLLGMWCGEVC